MRCRAEEHAKIELFGESVEALRNRCTLLCIEGGIASAGVVLRKRSDAETQQGSTRLTS